MVIYAAVAFVHNRISEAIKRVDVLLPPPSLKILQFFVKELKSFQNFVERLDSKSRERMSALLEGIFNTIDDYIDEDSFMCGGIDALLDEQISYEDLSGGIHSLVEQLKKVEKEYYTLQEDDHKEVVSSSSSRSVSKSKMVGLCIGKITLVQEIFEDLDIIEWFDCCDWVAAGFEWRTGKTRTSEEITEDILAQVDP
ncbi:hypothetical protein ACS0TY_025545 [Phlomoides rotata]